MLDACERLGLDTDALLSEAHLTRAEVLDPDRRLPAARADALWRAAFAQAEDPFLALHAAEALPFGAYKVVDFLCAHGATVEAAYRRVANYFRIVDVRAILDVCDDPPSLVMRTAVGVDVPPPAQEYTFTALIRRMAVCVAREWRPERVEFTFGAPPDVSEYERVLSAPVVFGAPSPRIVFSEASWAAPILGSEPSLFTVLEDHARRLAAELPAGDDLPSRVRAAVADGLTDGEPTALQIARRLGTSERTLQRRLQEVGLSYAQLLDDTRYAAARAHLRDPGLSLAEVAWLVGFSDQSTFTRAFRRWSGQPPGAWRAAGAP